MSPAVGARNFNHWTAREVPGMNVLYSFIQQLFIGHLYVPGPVLDPGNKIVNKATVCKGNQTSEWAVGMLSKLQGGPQIYSRGGSGWDPQR